jgi:CRISPR-associated protein Cas2
MFYVIAYDVSCDRRRKKISDLLEGYGERVQYSVFECILTKNKYKNLRQRLQKCCLENEDSIRFYPISQHTLTEIEVWGKTPITKLPGSTIV